MRALFVSVVLLTVFASPMITQQTTLEAERELSSAVFSPLWEDY